MSVEEECAKTHEKLSLWLIRQSSTDTCQQRSKEEGGYISVQALKIILLLSILYVNGLLWLVMNI